MLTIFPHAVVQAKLRERGLDKTILFSNEYHRSLAAAAEIETDVPSEEENENEGTAASEAIKKGTEEAFSSDSELSDSQETIESPTKV